jgi:AcrR family transcriptional regulator
MSLSKESPQPAAVDSKKQIKGPRPRRGSPAETRERIVAAAAKLFNTVGYHGTDSNRIADAAGYSPGAFYKHFSDKRAVFLAAYQNWIDAEWATIGPEVQSGGKPSEIARRVVDLTIDFHARWRGLRASLIGLVFADPEVRKFYRAQRRRQLDLMARILEARSGAVHSREQDALLLFTLERTADAIAQGEIRDLGLDRAAVVDRLVKQVTQALA